MSWSTADPHMSPEERTRVLDWLEQSRIEFLALIDNVTEPQWTWHPEPNRWTLGAVAEHIVLAEALLFGNVQKALALPPNFAWHEQAERRTKFIERVLAPRLGKAVAPLAIEPRDRMTATQVRQRFEAQRAEIVKFAAETALPLKQHTVDHPFPVFGTLNAYQWLIYVPLHTMRHGKQIAEVKATAGYPG
jgi:hypothetical protein